MHLDFWIRPITPGDPPLDRRATAEQELADFVAALPEGAQMPYVYLQQDMDWLTPGTAPEWIADMLATIARYPRCHYRVDSATPELWQQTMRAVAALDSPGGRIARDWRDGIPPLDLYLGCPADKYPILTAIPQRKPHHLLKRGSRITFLKDIAEPDIDRRDGEILDPGIFARAGDLGTVVRYAGRLGYLVRRDGFELEFEALHATDFSVS